MKCILCQEGLVFPWVEDNQRSYLRCESCSLIFVPRDQLLSAPEEKNRYDQHQNKEDDLRYREYLSKITTSVLQHLLPGSRGLDFGCGASTLLSQIFLESRVSVDSYDLYYHPDDKFRFRSYDFIVLSEVIEHLSDPRKTMEELRYLLRPGGQIFIKTRFVPEKEEVFSKWYYKNDPTHIQFFNHRSMEKLASLLGLKGPMALECTDLYRLY